jgi:hypothetical protein
MIGRTVSLVCLSALTLAAQDYRGSLSGRVSDASGAVVPGAVVTVMNEGTNARSTTRANEEGNYLVPLLDPAIYSVSVEAAGFKRINRTGVGVRTGDKLNLDFQLDVGNATESVTVTGELPLLQTNSADVAQVIDRRFVDLLFIADRNPLNLISLSPGVRGGGGRFSDSAQHTFSINGGGATEGRNEVVVDGASVVMPRQGGAIGTSPSGDTVEELRVQTTMFDAAYGHSNGGVVTYATRSGSNRPHGSFEGFLRNKALNANSWTNNTRGLARPDDNRQFYSGAAGGPVFIPKLYDGRNRTFFFTSVQKESRVSNPTYGGRVPSDLERQGDFSQTLSAQGAPLTIFNPYTSVVSGTTVARQPFSGAKIPASLFNETGVAIANAYPKANLSVPTQIGLYNWAELSRALNPAKQISHRMDQMISAHQRLFGRFAYMDWDVLFTALPAGLRNAPIGGDPTGDKRHFWNASLNDDYTLSPTLIGSLRYSFARYWSDTWFSGNVQDPKVLKLSPQILANQMRPSWPGIDMGEGFVRLGHRFKIRANDSHSLVPMVTKLAGAHSLRLGGEVRQVSWNEISPDSAAGGYFNFRPSFTQSDPYNASASRTSGTAMASLLLGIPESGNISGPTPYSMRSYYVAGFIQDDWKITRRLTVNFGLRWELETPYTERFNRLAYGFDTEIASPLKVPGYNLRGGMLFAGVDGNPRRQGVNDWNNFGPRAGFAWQVRPTTVVSGGYGIFYSSMIVNLDTNIPIPPSFSTSINYIGSTDRNVTPYTTLANPFPNGTPGIPGASQGKATRIGDSVSWVDQNKVLPYSQQWTFGLQQSLPWQIRAGANFIRMLSLKGLDGYNLNEKPDQYLALGAEENKKVANPFYGLVPSTAPLGSADTLSQRQLWLMFPQYSSVNVSGVNTHTTVYHALQLTLEKRLTHGLTVIANHSISKMMENNITSVVNERHYRSISDMDRPHITNLAFVYDLPVGKGRALAASGLLNRVAGGWSVSGRYNYSSGTPLSISDNNGRPYRLQSAAKSGPVGQRLGDRVDPVTKQVLNPYFDTTAFVSLPTQYMVSPEPPSLSELRNPAGKSMALSLIKRFGIREGLNFDVRADATNITNTPQWDGPGTSMGNKGTFGVIQTADGRRIVQLSFRMVF